ncbi:hypothetical protein GCM10029992_62270 [Glycomyces albus]
MRMPLFALSIGAFGIGTTEFVVMGTLSDIADSTGVSVAQAGLLVTAYALGVVIGAPLLTVATTKVARKRLLIALMACFAAANLATAAAPTSRPCSGPASSRACRTARSSGPPPWSARASSRSTGAPGRSRRSCPA